MCDRCLGKGSYPVAKVDAVTGHWTSVLKTCRSCGVKPNAEGEYDHDYILANPIPALCRKCRRQWTAKSANGPIFAPGLSCCRCFYCHGELIELYQPGDELPLQPSLFS